MKFKRNMTRSGRESNVQHDDNFSEEGKYKTVTVVYEKYRVWEKYEKRIYDSLTISMWIGTTGGDWHLVGDPLSEHSSSKSERAVLGRVRSQELLVRLLSS